MAPILSVSSLSERIMESATDEASSRDLTVFPISDTDLKPSAEVDAAPRADLATSSRRFIHLPDIRYKRLELIVRLRHVAKLGLDALADLVHRRADAPRRPPRFLRGGRELLAEVDERVGLDLDGGDHLAEADGLGIEGADRDARAHRVVHGW